MNYRQDSEPEPEPEPEPDPEPEPAPDTGVPLRRAVSTLDRSNGIPVELADYAQGFAAMSALPESNPWSLEHQAAIHARNMDGLHQPDPDWDWCQHQNWFFLPWHRMYLRQFEKILGQLIGKPDWRLPYWDYTSASEAAWQIPSEFLQPADPVANPLFVTGRVGSGLNGDDRDATDALAATTFTSLVTLDDFGSGMVTQAQQFWGSHTGRLENQPHNVVHMAVGGRMGDPSGAGFDPIFWLHHANIDRLWAVWINEGHANSADPNWLATEFDFPDSAAAGARKTYKVQDVLETEPIGYRYDDLSAPVPPPGALVRGAVPTMAAGLADESRTPEVIGATAGSVSLDPGATHVVALERPSDWRLADGALAGIAGDEDADRAVLDSALEGKILLQLERVTGTNVPVGVYGVYVNVPEGEDPGDHPDRKAGQFGTFGLEAASAGAGGGMTLAFDITGIVRRLTEEGRWDPESLRVTFDAEVHKADAGGSLAPAEHDVKAGSIRLVAA